MTGLDKDSAVFQACDGGGIGPRDAFWFIRNGKIVGPLKRSGSCFTAGGCDYVLAYTSLEAGCPEAFPAKDCYLQLASAKAHAVAWLRCRLAELNEEKARLEELLNLYEC